MLFRPPESLSFRVFRYGSFSLKIWLPTLWLFHSDLSSMSFATGHSSHSSCWLELATLLKWDLKIRPFMPAKRGSSRLLRPLQPLQVSNWHRKGNFGLTYFNHKFQQASHFTSSPSSIALSLKIPNTTIIIDCSDEDLHFSDLDNHLFVGFSIYNLGMKDNIWCNLRKFKIKILGLCVWKLTNFNSTIDSGTWHPNYLTCYKFWS